MLFDAFHNNHRVSIADTVYLCTSVIFNPESLKSVVCMQAISSKLPFNWVFAIADCMTADTIYMGSLQAYRQKNEHPHYPIVVIDLGHILVHCKFMS